MTRLSSVASTCPRRRPRATPPRAALACLIGSALALGLLGGCGQKGPLRLRPADAASAPVTAPQPATPGTASTAPGATQDSRTAN